MIERLTKEQEDKLPFYRDKWLKIGLSTERIDRSDAIKRWHEFDKEILKNSTKSVVIFMGSPLTTWLATLCLYNLLYNSGNRQDISQVWSQVWSQVKSQVLSQVRAQVESQVESQVGSQVGPQVESQVGSQVESQVRSFVYPYLDGHFWSYYFSFYDFCNKVLGIKLSVQKQWDCLLKTSDVEYVYPFEEFVVVSEKPTQIKMREGLLHNEHGASIRYADGFEVYSLNGVRVNKDLVMTPAQDLDPQLLLKEPNAEIRREIVRKIGIERVCQKLNTKTLDKQGDYELCILDIGDRRRPYLKMINPSIGIFHIEGVAPEIKTVEQALNWRNQTETKPEVLT